MTGSLTSAKNLPSVPLQNPSLTHWSEGVNGTKVENRRIFGPGNKPINLDRPEAYEQLDYVTKTLKELVADQPFNLKQPECTEYFFQNSYVRKLKIYAGSLALSRIHKFEHMITLSEGRAHIFEHTGNREVCAPWEEIAPPGTTRVVHAITDCTFMTIHPGVAATVANDMRDVISVETGKEYFKFLAQSDLALLEN